MMNLKNSLSLSAAICLTAIIGFNKPSQATDTHNQQLEQTSQASSVQMSQNSTVSLTERLRIPIGVATYKLEEPALQFDYDPNVFIFTSFDTADLEDRSLMLRTLSLWTKEDYLALRSTDNEIGDFADRIRITVYANPDGIPAPDWISRWFGQTSGSTEIEGISSTPDTTVAGQDAWTFSYRSLFKYDGIAFQATNGQIVVITAYTPDLEEDSEPYSSALSRIVTSMALVDNQLPDEVIQGWRHSFEEDTEDTMVYRPASYAFPSARGRSGISFVEGGRFVDQTIAPTDALQEISGSWRVQDNGHVLIDFDSETGRPRVMEIVEYSSDILKIRQTPMQE